MYVPIKIGTNIPELNEAPNRNPNFRKLDANTNAQAEVIIGRIAQFSGRVNRKKIHAANKVIIAIAVRVLGFILNPAFEADQYVILLKINLRETLPCVLGMGRCFLLEVSSAFASVTCPITGRNGDRMSKNVIIFFVLVATICSYPFPSSAGQKVNHVKAWIVKLDEAPLEARVDCLPQQNCMFKIGDNFTVNLTYQQDTLYSVSTLAYGLPTDGPDCCSFRGNQRESSLDARKGYGFYDLYFHRPENLSLRKPGRFGRLYISIKN